MPQKTFASNKSSLFADGSSNLGGGADDHMPVGGPYSGYTFRSAVRFALDFNGVKSITSAIMRLKVSDQVHVAFSSDPDIYVARATADWTANGSSGSSDGGSGWGTSPTVYPGPASTTTNRVSKDITTTQNADVDIDITGIVRDWMAGNPNYGVLLYYVASGDITEFYSYRHGTAGNRPEIILNYNVDTAPVATMTGPTGAVGTTRPTLTGSGSDADGDAITDVYVEVRQGATPIHTANLGAVGMPWSYVPTADLPGGALTAVSKVLAGGLWSAFSSEVAFTVDRPPVVGAFSSPPASGSNRRPVITFAYSDPDGNTADAYHLQVYATSGGVAVGTPVYEYAPGGSFPSPISHTPTADLPGGQLVVRASVRSGPAALWSGWSADYPFLIALTSPTIAWLAPAFQGAFMYVDWLSHLESSFGDAYGIAQVEIRPPAGQTLTRLRLWISGINADPSVSGSLVYDLAPDPVGGLFSYGLAIGPDGGGQYSSAWEATASGGGVTKAWRMGRMVATEYMGRVSLGDNVTALYPDGIDGGGDDAWRWYRAEDAAGTGLSVWGTPAEALAAMPYQGAYLGLRVRSMRGTLQDANLLTNGSFEQGLTGWVTDAGTTYLFIAGGPDGTQYLRIPGDGVTAYPQVRQTVDVVPGGTYTLAGYLGTFEAPANIYVRADAILDDNTSVIAVLQITRTSSFDTGLTYYATAGYLVPQNCHRIQVIAYIAAAPAASNIDARFDGLSLSGPKVGDGGLRSWRIDWTSAG